MRVKIYDGGGSGSGPIIVCGKVGVEIKRRRWKGWWNRKTGIRSTVHGHWKEAGKGTQEDLLCCIWGTEEGELNLAHTIKPRLAPVLFGKGRFGERAGEDRVTFESEASSLTVDSKRFASWALSSRSRSRTAASSALSCSTSEARALGVADTWEFWERARRRAFSVSSSETRLQV